MSARHSEAEFETAGSRLGPGGAVKDFAKSCDFGLHSRDLVRESATGSKDFAFVALPFTISSFRSAFFGLHSSNINRSLLLFLLLSLFLLL